jgi:hypothetical protein
LTMESRTLANNNNDVEPKANDKVEETNDDDMTEAAGSNRGKNDAVEAEKNVKWQIPGNHDVSTAKKLLQQLLAYLLVHHPGEVTLIDGKQREWTFNETDDEEKFANDCEQISVQIHPIKNKQQQILRWVAITRIHSISTSQDWKYNDHFYAAMDAAGAYVFPHPFGYDEWDTTTIGFIKDIHAIHYPRELLHEQLDNMLKKQNKNPPQFQLIPQRITTNDKQASTKAFTVQCVKDDASKLMHLFTHGPFRSESNQVFVPFRYKTKNPDLFLRCIRQQNEVYHKTWIIKLEGITPDIMEYIRHDIQPIMGVRHIVPSKRLHEIGEWKILADQTKCAYIHRQLTESWKKIINKVPAHVLEASPDNFALPAISSKRAREYQDNESDNDSYGSLLTTGTEISTMTTDDVLLNELPVEYKYPTYASAATNSHKSGHDTPVSSPTNSTQTGWQKERQELEEQIKAQAAQIDKIQADLQSKISRSKDLEDKLAQALDLAHSRDKRHEEILTKFEMLMTAYPSGHSQPIQNDDGHNNVGNTSLPTTPDRTHPSEDPSRPPKRKANTNSSPHRNIYSLFRAAPSKQTPRHLITNQTQTTGTTTLPLTQPMETDEATRQPTPGAKPGHKSQ